MAARSARPVVPAVHRLRRDVPMREWTVLAQDPAVVAAGGKALTTRVTLPAERLEAGPKGHRVHVVDFDTSADTFYRPRDGDPAGDAYRDATDIDKLVADPHFHQQNVYGVTMATLGLFERALGRPVSWAFDSHQLKVAPHAFADANAFYSRASESLCFGYFAGHRGRTIHTCLSHDIIAHETTHALIDGLRGSYLHPSSSDQAAFHEGFSDVVALLTVLQSPELVSQSLAGVVDRNGRVPPSQLTCDALAQNALLKLAEQFGDEIGEVRGHPLRHSVELPPSRRWLGDPEFDEPHRRGEILSAAMLRAFLDVWVARLEPMGLDRGLSFNRSVVAEEGASAAKQLARVAVRALDYLPPVDLGFSDFLSGLLTADAQLFPDDTRYGYRACLRRAFASYGIEPASDEAGEGMWCHPEADDFRYEGTHFELMRTDPDTVYRFVWENRAALQLDGDAYTRVTALRPSLRIGEDGCALRENVVEYVQTLKVWSNELKSIGIRKPDGMGSQQLVTLYGGGTLIFDEYGRLKFHIGTGVASPRQSDRLESLWRRGDLDRTSAARGNFAQMHRNRGLRRVALPRERW